VDDLCATKCEDVGLIVRAISFQDFQFNLCGHDPPTSQTDRRTDGQTTCNSKTALCTIVHCAIKTNPRRVSNLAPPPEVQMVQSFQLQGVLPPDSLPGASLLGAPPQTPIWVRNPVLAMTRAQAPPPQYNILASPMI